MRAGMTGAHAAALAPLRRRERTPPEVREAREKERELKELDRDIRTVFAYNLPLKADERDLFEFFSKAGTVEDVRIIMDRNTRRSKGFAYIEYGNRVRARARPPSTDLHAQEPKKDTPMACPGTGGSCRMQARMHAHPCS